MNRRTGEEGQGVLTLSTSEARLVSVAAARLRGVRVVIVEEPSPASSKAKAKGGAKDEGQRKVSQMSRV